MRDCTYEFEEEAQGDYYHGHGSPDASYSCEKKICFYRCDGVVNFSTFLPAPLDKRLYSFSFPHTYPTQHVLRLPCSRRRPFHLARVSPVFSVNDGQTLIRHLPADNAKRIVKRAVSSLSLMKLPES